MAASGVEKGNEVVVTGDVAKEQKAGMTCDFRDTLLLYTSDDNIKSIQYRQLM